MSHDVDLVDKIDFRLADGGPHSFPIVRTGCILLSDFDITNELGLKARNKIDTSLGATGGKYFDLISNFQDSGVKFSRKTDLDEKFKWKSGDKPILDSPEVVLSLDDYTILARHCLTVCSFTRKSKIWSRYTLLSINSNRADSLNELQVQDFYTAVKTFSQEFTDQWRELYLSDLADVGISKDIFFPYPFEVSAVNYSPRKINRLRNSLAAGRSLTSEMSLAINKLATNSLLTIGSAPLFGRRMGFNDAIEMVNKLKPSDLELVIHDLRQGAGTAAETEEVTSVFLLASRPEGAFSFGLCCTSRVEAELESDDPAFRYTRGTAHESTGLLLEHYASRF